MNPASALTAPLGELIKPETYLDALQFVLGGAAAMSFPKVVNMVATVPNVGWKGYAMNLVGSALASGIVGVATKNKVLASRVFVGGLVITGFRAVVDFFGATLGMRPMSGLSASQERLEAEIAEEVKRSLGVSDFPMREEQIPMSDFPMREEQIPMADYPMHSVSGFPTHELGEADEDGAALAD
jgi:hypothetical protein